MTITCFVAGTQIRKPEGDVAVETLHIGELVLTTSGESRPIKWIGHRVIDCRQHPDPAAVYPIRIAAGAFGPNRPSQDLRVSSSHSIGVDLVGEVLIPAGILVNGATIAPVEVDEVSYWHVELESHDILIANNLPAESYLEAANRGFFEEAGATVDVFQPKVAQDPVQFCRPFVTDANVLAFVRQRLTARAEAIGWTPVRDPELRLFVDGKAVHPRHEGDAAVFLFPTSARDVRLLSNTFIPANLGGKDTRRLGVCLLGLTFAGAGGALRRISLDDARLAERLHDGELKSGAHWAWTKGDLPLDPQFWADLKGLVSLFVKHNSAATRQWSAPSRPEAHSGKSKRKLFSIR